MLIKLTSPDHVDQVIERLSKFEWIEKDYISIITHIQKKFKEIYLQLWRVVLSL